MGSPCLIFSGFDPLGLSKPVEYLQFDLDNFDMNKARNPAGQLLGKLQPVDNTPKEDALVVRLSCRPVLLKCLPYRCGRAPGQLLGLRASSNSLGR